MLLVACVRPDFRVVSVRPDVPAVLLFVILNVIVDFSWLLAISVNVEAVFLVAVCVCSRELIEVLVERSLFITVQAHRGRVDVCSLAGLLAATLMVICMVAAYISFCVPLVAFTD